MSSRAAQGIPQSAIARRALQLARWKEAEQASQREASNQNQDQKRARASRRVGFSPRAVFFAAVAERELGE